MCLKLLASVVERIQVLVVHENVVQQNWLKLRNVRHVWKQQWAFVLALCFEIEPNISNQSVACTS